MISGKKTYNRLCSGQLVIRKMLLHLEFSPDLNQYALEALEVMKPCYLDTKYVSCNL